jgi:pyruvate dehydrogenase E1 component alpha subunit
MTDQISKEILIGFYRILETIYAVKDNISLLAENNEIKQVNKVSYGDEAIAAGVFAALKDEDIIINTCDGISGIIARGGSLNSIFTEIMGKSEGYNNGIRGIFNISVPELGIYSANSFSDTGAAMGTGFALASKLRDENKVIAAFYNNETVNEGIIHESINIASAFDLPMLFVCKNSKNFKGAMPEEFLQESEFGTRSLGYGIQSATVNGMDIESVYIAAQKSIKSIREDKRPAILECITGIFNEELCSCRPDLDSKNLIENADFNASTIKENFAKILLDKKILTQTEMENVQKEVNVLVKKSVELSKAGSDPKPEDLAKFMYADNYSKIIKPEGGHERN